MEKWSDGCRLMIQRRREQTIPNAQGKLRDRSDRRMEKWSDGSRLLWVPLDYLGNLGLQK
jgi:hypothetical protein